MAKEWAYSTEPDDFDAGRIAEEHEFPGRRREKGENSLVDGINGGAYRVVISTDVAWGCDPKDSATLIGALCMVMQNFAPIQVFVQQGWWSSGSRLDGVTIFPVAEGLIQDFSLLSFWAGSPNKDSLFSRVVNKLLGRQGTACWLSSVIPCNYFVDSITVPSGAPEKVQIDWVQKNAVKALLQGFRSVLRRKEEELTFKTLKVL